jgi:N6-adenosine-specific RNA methylase IME4
MKYRVLVADCPWKFSDPLLMSNVKRGASSVYNTLTITDLKNLPVKDIAEDDSILLLWCPSSLLEEGLEVMKSWGFSFKQTHIWVKVKKNVLFSLISNIKKIFSNFLNEKITAKTLSSTSFDLGSVLSFGMGRLFRQTHELALVGVRGKIYNHLENKSQRSVHFFPSTKHSVKPDILQDMLEKMFPGKEHNKIELFARRSKNGWTCVGLESPSTIGEDIRDSIERLKNENIKIG